MSFDRFLAVVFPVGSMSIRTSHNASVVILITWLIICLANVPIAVDHGYFEYNFAGQMRSECVNLRIASGDKSYGQGLFGCFFAFAYVVPLLSICLLYGFMLTALAGHGGRTGGRPASSDGSTELNQNAGCRSANRLRCKKRVTRMVLVVVLVFAACWAPIQILLIIQHFGTIRSTELYTMFLVVGNCLSYLNSCVNPFLYAFLSENFRKSFCKMLCCAGLVTSTAAFAGAGTRANGAQGDLQLTNMRTATTTQMSKSHQHQGHQQQQAAAAAAAAAGTTEVTTNTTNYIKTNIRSREPWSSEDFRTLDGQCESCTILYCRCLVLRSILLWQLWNRSSTRHDIISLRHNSYLLLVISCCTVVY